VDVRAALHPPGPRSTSGSSAQAIGLNSWSIDDQKAIEVGQLSHFNLVDWHVCCIEQFAQLTTLGERDCIIYFDEL
jgi:hypothetical protein